MRPRSFLTTRLPDLGVRADVGQRHALERELGRALGVVMAVGAVAVDDVLRRSRALFDARLASGEREGARRRKRGWGRA